tara:strand:+ start:16761 stop:18338 length:1578 start_codon:yes stop_codon:yes gene_type:complete
MIIQVAEAFNIQSLKNAKMYSVARRRMGLSGARFNYYNLYDKFVPNTLELQENLRSLNSIDYRYLNFISKKMFYYIHTVYDPRERELINIGLYIAYIAHYRQNRKSGEKFIIHPVSVSIILSQSGADYQTIVAGLLHDTVEDTSLSFEDIENVFGSEVRKIVEGETKVSKIPKFTRFKKIPSRQCLERSKLEQNENLRSMFIAMADDWRIIVVKLADRLHNMRTLQFMSERKQIEISKETLKLFVPLAHRLGLWHYKTELEDLSFKYLRPKEYYKINKNIRKLKKKNEKTLKKARECILSVMEKNSLFDFHIETRTKSIYSIWKKASSNGCDIDEVLDILAVRIIIEPSINNFLNDDIYLCYHVLGDIHRTFTPLPKTLKDYISSPKPNGYKSLHTTVLINSQPVEIQIRTKDMHQIAEWGTAAHWAYKGKDSSLSWLQIVRTWDTQVNSSSEFMKRVRTELLGSRVFVFGLNGEILNLAKGAQLQDAIEKMCKYSNTTHVTVNNKFMSRDYILKNGDILSFHEV